MRMAVGLRARPSVIDDTTGMAPPNPSTSCDVRPASWRSSTPTTCCGRYRMTELAVFEVMGPKSPSARIRNRGWDMSQSSGGESEVSGGINIAAEARAAKQIWPVEGAWHILRPTPRTAKSLSSLGDLLETELRDRYVIERELGEGGMARVWLATDVRHHRTVALKVLRPELALSGVADRFLREVRVLAELQHPHILALLDSGLVPVTPAASTSVPATSCRSCAGESLRERLTREGPLPLETVNAITSQVAAALDYAHKRGVVHRDVKPENLLLADDQVYLADFGIASALEDAAGSRLTETGLTLGTPAYMSPEQAAAERRIDGRSDQYSLACVVLRDAGRGAAVHRARRRRPSLPSDWRGRRHRSARCAPLFRRTFRRSWRAPSPRLPPIAFPHPPLSRRPSTPQWPPPQRGQCRQRTPAPAGGCSGASRWPRWGWSSHSRTWRRGRAAASPTRVRNPGFRGDRVARASGPGLCTADPGRDQQCG